MKILQAHRDDVHDIVRLNDVVQKMHAEQHPDVFKYPTQPSQVEEFFCEKIVAEDSFVLMAIVDEARVGYVWCTIQRRSENPFKYAQNRMYIHQLAVDPDFRRREVGRQLMLAVEEIAARHNIKGYALDIWAFNEGAQAFFERLGFTRYNINMWYRSD